MNRFTCPCCKYEFETNYVEGVKENNYITKGDEEPIEIKAKKEDDPLNMSHFGITDHSLWNSEIRVKLHACPKCKIVVLDYNK